MLRGVVLLGLLSHGLLVQAKISPEQIGIIVNANDADSVAVADYYREKRHIPQANIIEVKLPLDRDVINKKLFNQIYAEVKSQTPANVQFYAIAWSKPYRVQCMSITSAFAFGFDDAFCAKGCKRTKTSQYYNSDSEQPFLDLGVRPSMMLAGSSLQQVKDLIDRGVRSDALRPVASAYLMSTSNKARNVRSRRYPAIENALADKIHIEQIHADVLRDRDDVMFYFTGLSTVKSITDNVYEPGAIADHLTSSGGKLFGSRQMSILRWLEAGATGSYGTVVEPCAFTQKFPNPAIVIDRYTNGESLIEAYWKSVAWPGQGVFVGEPMASPYAKSN